MILNKYDEKTVEEIAACYRRILELVGEDPSREGLLKTPVRAAKAIMDITRGYREDPEGIVRSAIFERLYPRRTYCGLEQVGPYRRCVCPPLASAGTPHWRDMLAANAYPYEQRGDSGVPGWPFVHEDARSGKARQHNGDDGLQRCLCRRCFVAPRVP